MAAHENLQAHRTAKRGSNRAFGLVFAGVFTLVSLWPLTHQAPFRWWALAVALVLAALAVFAPHRLATLNGAWLGLGLALNRVLSPVVLRLLYFAILTPFAKIMRWFGHEFLPLRQPQAATYWIARDPPGPPAGGMTRQF